MSHGHRSSHRATAVDHCVTGEPSMTPARSTRRLRALALGATVLSVVAPAAGASGTAVAKGTTWAARSGGGNAAQRDVIVQAKAGAAASVAAAVRALGGSVGDELPLVNGFAAKVP